MSDRLYKLLVVALKRCMGISQEEFSALPEDERTRLVAEMEAQGCPLEAVKAGWAHLLKETESIIFIGRECGSITMHKHSEQFDMDLLRRTALDNEYDEDVRTMVARIWVRRAREDDELDFSAADDQKILLLAARDAPGSGAGWRDVPEAGLPAIHIGEPGQEVVIGGALVVRGEV